MNICAVDIDENQKDVIIKSLSGVDAGFKHYYDMATFEINETILREKIVSDMSEAYPNMTNKLINDIINSIVYIMPVGEHRTIVKMI